MQNYTRRDVLMPEMKSLGQIDYETSVAACPFYHDKTPRKPWAQLDKIIRDDWDRIAVAVKTEQERISK